jgi:hypothetical protein
VLHRLGEIRVVEDHVGALAAELEGDALDGPRRDLAHTLARAGRPREADHVDLCVTGDRLTHRGAVTGHEVEDTGRKAGLVDDLGQDEGAQGRDLARVEDDGAARCDGRGHLGRHLVEGVIPRRDATDDADGLPDDDRGPDLLLGAGAPREGERCAERRERQPGLNHRAEGQRHPDFGRDRFGDLLAPLGEPRLDARQGLGTLLGARSRPALEGGPGSYHRAVHVRAVTGGDSAEGLLGRRVDDAE